MEKVIAVSGKANFAGCQAALQGHLRDVLRGPLAPALIAEVTALVESGTTTCDAIACIIYFLDNGACLDARNAKGEDTALLIAARVGQLDAVNAMLDHWSLADQEGGARSSGGSKVINAVGGEYKAKFNPEIVARLLTYGRPSGMLA
eukprot:gene4022-10845_t